MKTNSRVVLVVAAVIVLVIAHASVFYFGIQHAALFGVIVPVVIGVLVLGHLRLIGRLIDLEEAFMGYLPLERTWLATRSSLPSDGPRTYTWNQHVDSH